jgi:type VI secretion system protein ImpL
MVAYWVTGGLLLVYLVLVWFVPSWLNKSGTDAWILRGGLALLGLIAAGSFIWFYRKAKTAEEGQGVDGTGDSNKDIDLLVHEALRRLKNSTLGRGATLRNLPLVFVLGEPGSAKTHTVIHSALDPELLGGQVYQDNSVLPTRVANIWYSRAAAFVDPSGSLMSQPGRWRRLIKLVQPGRVSSAVGKRQQAPRAAVVCVSCENFLDRGAGETTLSTARKLATRLHEISQTLGISFPVYVLFTKLDRLSFFVEYVRGLSHEEASQVLGATLPIRNLDAGVYADEETKRLNKAFDELFYSLADRRMDLLARENQSEDLPKIYEFPRELNKLRTFAVQFLVELGRPSQLSTNPFLRGFYFSGARPVLIEDSVSMAQVETEGEDTGPAGATVIFSSRSKQSAAPAAARAAGARKVPQWVFLSQLFNDVITKDRVALTASGFSSRVSLLRRVGLIVAAALALAIAVGFTVSYFGNRAIENRVHDAVRDLQSVGANPSQPASLADLQKLDRLRTELVALSDNEANGVPWRLRLGLYVGDRIYPDARRFYFDRFQQLLLSDTQNRIVSKFRECPAQLTADADFRQTYDALKAYLITTAYHEKSTMDFLPRELKTLWASGRNVEPERQALAETQFGYYARELPTATFFSKDSDKAAIQCAQDYLDLFKGIERSYVPLIDKVSRSNQGVSYSNKFPNGAGVVSSPRNVSGAFTPSGFASMETMIRNPSDVLGGEKWVLGDKTASEVDQGSIQQKLRQRYYDDYAKQWREMLGTSHVDTYHDFADAVQKLKRLTEPGSPLLELLWLVSSNTNVGDAKLKDAFASAQAVVPPGDPLSNPVELKGQANAAYMAALSDLQAKLDSIVHSPNGISDQALLTAAIQSAAQAKGAAGQAAGTRVDNDYHTENVVRNLLEEPITYAENLINTGPKEALNAAGKQFCQQFAQIADKYPFNPRSGDDASVDVFNGIFAPRTGSLWTIFDAAKLSQFVVRQGSSYQSVSSGTVKINQSFLDFYNRAAGVSESFYPGGSATPRFSYVLRVMPSNLDGVVLRIGSETLSGAGAQKTFTWTGNPAEQVVASTAGGDVLGSFTGPWAIFHFVADATTNPHSRIYGSTADLEWVMQSNNRTIMLQNGKPKSYNYQLQVNGWNPFGSLGLSGMRCEPHVAR